MQAAAGAPLRAALTPRRARARLRRAAHQKKHQAHRPGRAQAPGCRPFLPSAVAAPDARPVAYAPAIGPQPPRPGRTLRALVRAAAASAAAAPRHSVHSVAGPASCPARRRPRAQLLPGCCGLPTGRAQAAGPPPPQPRPCCPEALATPTYLHLALCCAELRGSVRCGESARRLRGASCGAAGSPCDPPSPVTHPSNPEGGCAARSLACKTNTCVPTAIQHAPAAAKKLYAIQRGHAALTNAWPAPCRHANAFTPCPPWRDSAIFEPLSFGCRCPSRAPLWAC
jgi:hypothetical protein